MIQITTVSHTIESFGVKVLLYGSAGVGKTVLAATMPAPLLLSAEAGTLSIRAANLERLFGPNRPDVCYDMPLITIRTVEDLMDAYRWLTSSKESAYFQSVVIDSLSEIAEIVLENAKRQVKDPRQAYNEVLEKTKDAVRAFRDLPKHVCFMTHQATIKDEMTGVVRYGPSLPGQKLALQLPHFFDEYFRLGINKTPQGQSYRFIQTQPDLQHEAKDRSGALAPQEHPHLGNIIAKIQHQ